MTQIPNLKEIFKKYPSIKLAYLFGSQAKKEVGPLSDYDFAFWFDEPDPKIRFDLKLGLFAEISRILKTDQVDIVILNDAEAPELKYNIVKEGQLIYEIEPFKVIVESKIWNEYFDFHATLLRSGLTKNKT